MSTPTPKTDAIATRGSTAVALPDYLKDKTGPGRGAEGLEGNDIRPPRLMLCQSTTPHRKRTDPKYIAGLEEGYLFNDIEERIYGEGPLDVVIIRFLGKRGIEFNEDGSVKAFNVPLNDARMEFTDGPNGERVKPVATLFYDYLVYLPEYGDILALSMKGTQIKVAQQVNSIIKLAAGRGIDSYAMIFTIAAVEQHQDAYNFYNFKMGRKKSDDLKPAFVDAETYKKLADIYESFEGKTVVIEVEPDSVTDATPVDKGAAVSDNIPF